MAGEDRKIVSETVSENSGIEKSDGIFSSPILPGQAVFSDVQQSSLQSQTDDNQGVSSSDILAPRQNLSESLDTLKEFSDTPPQQEVVPEEITAQTKLTVEEDPHAEEDTKKELYSYEVDPNDHSSVRFLKDLYDNSNECMTSATGSFPVNEETRKL